VDQDGDKTMSPKTIKKYDWNSPKLYKNYERKNKVKNLPYFVLENVLSTNDVDAITSILDNYESSTRNSNYDFVKAHHDDPKIRYIFINCTESDMSSDVENITTFIPEFKVYDDVIIEKCLDANEKIWNLNIDSMITALYKVYDTGSKMQWHPDGPFGVNAIIPDDLRWRKLSATVALNDEEYEGGHFQIMDSSYSQDIVTDIKLSKGSILLYPAFMKHRICPVNSGKRRSLIYWFCGPRWI